MPTGKVINPSGPDSAQGELGQIISIKGEILPFHNTINLDMHEPVLYQPLAYKITLDGVDTRITIAVLENDGGGHPMMRKNKWDTSFKSKWDDEWSHVDPDALVELNIKNMAVTVGDILKYFGAKDKTNGRKEVQ